MCAPLVLQMSPSKSCLLMVLPVVPFFRRTLKGPGEGGSGAMMMRVMGMQEVMLSGGHSVLAGSCLPARYFIEQNRRICSIWKRSLRSYSPTTGLSPACPANSFPQCRVYLFLENQQFLALPAEACPKTHFLSSILLLELGWGSG